MLVCDLDDSDEFFTQRPAAYQETIDIFLGDERFGILIVD